MENRPAEQAEWYQALRLRERVPPSSEDLPKIPFDAERAGKRLERWRSLPPFPDDGRFDRRLAADGLEPEGLLALLGESPENLRDRLGEAPGWLREVEEAYSAQPPAEAVPWPREARSEGVHSEVFLVLVEPLVHRGCERLRRVIQDLAAAGGGPEIDSEATVRSALASLENGLRHLLGRPMVLELQAARLEGELPGDTPEERFWSFVESLRRPEVALETLQRYPVLAREAVESVERWAEVGEEALRRLAADWPEILRRLGPAEEPGAPGALIELDGGKGDPHRGRRSVFLLRFAGGFRLVYKPKSLAVDAAFQGLLQWANARGFEPALRPLRLLDRGAYGWMEFVEPAPCATAEEVRRFYRRQGAHLALLYLVDGTDFHHENMIAAGEHPVLIDLETLFHPDVEARGAELAAQGPGWSLRDSLLRGGLLPARLWGGAGRPGLEMSGLAASAGGGSVAYWGAVAGGTDEMRFGRKEAGLGETTNRPTLQGAEVPLLDHSENLLEGFRRLYGLLVEHREGLLSPGGALAAFAEAEVRIVFRPTAYYFTLLTDSFHPYRLASGLDRARVLDGLWQGAAERPFLAPLVPFEHRDLERGDIPFFTTRPGSRDVWASGGERLPGFLPETGLDRAARRLARLGPADRARQEWLVRGSFSVLRLEGRQERPRYPFREAAEPASRERLLAAARAAAERLAELAFDEGDRAHWMSVEHGGDDAWIFRPAQPDLYLGLPGIALALGYLGNLFGEERWARLARLALAAQRYRLAEDPSLVPEVGGFNGRGGLIYALAHLGALWGDEALLDEAEAMARELGPRIDADEQLDLVIGSAGCLLALLALHRARPSEAVRDLAIRCGERLLATARPMEAGLGWVVPVAGPRPCSGISHGAAGVALTLLSLWGETGDDRFREAALGGIAYERSLFSPEHRNWRDVREGADELAESEEDLYLCGWCHGAPGIGLARVAGLPWLDEPAAREEIAAAVATTLARGLGKNHSLCHGDVGNADFLAQAARATGDRDLEARVGRIAGGILDGIEAHGWIYGLAVGAEPLGLMVGLAGIAWGLARLAAPDRLPDVLALAPPRHF